MTMTQKYSCIPHMSNKTVHSG